MISQRTLLGLVLGSAAACAAVAQTTGALRWRAGAAPLGLQVQVAEDSAAWRIARAKGASISLVGKSEMAPELGIFGRVGTTSARPLVGAAAESGMSYGVGLSWDFSRRGSASLGWDSYDLRSASGDARDVRATSLGLQWRY